MPYVKNVRYKAQNFCFRRSFFLSFFCLLNQKEKTEQRKSERE